MYKTGKILIYLKEGSIGNGRTSSLSVRREQTDNLTLDLTQAGSFTGRGDMWLVWAGFVEERRKKAFTMPGKLCCVGSRAAHGAMLNYGRGI